MPLPSNKNLATLDYAYLGQPFVQVEAKSLDTETLNTAYLGQPFVAVGPVPYSVFVKLNGVWREAIDMWVFRDGGWKNVKSINVKAWGAWAD
jgi:hypothetical protein